MESTSTLPVKMDVKRYFRLRPVDATVRLNRRYAYLKSPCIRSIVCSQLFIGFVTIIAQILIFCTSQRQYQDDLVGSGMGIGMIQVLASVFTLMAADDPAYYWEIHYSLEKIKKLYTPNICRLHLAMSFNIISSIGSYAVGFYIMNYPIKYFIELESYSNNYSAQSKPESPYIDREIGTLTSCMYTIVISCVASFVVGTFLTICTARPVCCGQGDLLPVGIACRRKSSTDCHKGHPTCHGGRPTIKLGFRKNRNSTDVGGAIGNISPKV